MLPDIRSFVIPGDLPSITKGLIIFCNGAPIETTKWSLYLEAGTITFEWSSPRNRTDTLFPFSFPWLSPAMPHLCPTRYHTVRPGKAALNSVKDTYDTSARNRASPFR
jgi:hypothetical protein